MLSVAKPRHTRPWRTPFSRFEHLGTMNLPYKQYQPFSKILKHCIHMANASPCVPEVMPIIQYLLLNMLKILSQYLLPHVIFILYNGIMCCEQQWDAFAYRTEGITRGLNIFHSSAYYM